MPACIRSFRGVLCPFEGAISSCLFHGYRDCKMLSALLFWDVDQQTFSSEEKTKQAPQSKHPE